MVSFILSPMLCLTVIIATTTTTLLQFPPPISGAATDDNDRPPYHDCGGNTAYSYTAGSEFEQTLNNTLYTNLTAAATAASRTYANITNNVITNGTLVDRVYALYFCRGDIDVSTCQNCVNDAVEEITQKCKFKKQGIVWYEFCTLRYANHSIFALDEKSPYKMYYNRSGDLVSEFNLEPHRQIFSSTMDDVVVAAANNDNATASGYFYEKEVNLSSWLKLRGIAQCSPLIGNRVCGSCVRVARNRLDLWANTMVFHPSCNFKFDLYGHPRPPSSFSPPGGSDRKKTIILAVLLPIVAILILVGGFWFWKRSQSPDTEKTTKETPPSELETINNNGDETRLQLTRFTYSDVKDMTNEFNKRLGEGGYGIVYFGRLKSDNKEIAVKVLEKIDAPKQFSNEINVLGRIHHKNLVSLIGYCEEGTSNLALIYEYMPRGDLKALMSEHSDVVVSWKSRLAIAFDMAQGLEYLHTGCSPSIVHRDVKPANILLDNNLRAKVADFGLSKIFPPDYVSQLETRVIGTPGYVDPQYQSTGRVTEKSDVYSYGVVLLELITGKTAIMKSTSTHLVQWVTPLYVQGDIGSILDPRLRVEVGENYMTVWKATELAKKCVEPDDKDRPTMNFIVTELRDCLARENVEAGSPMSLGTQSMEILTAAAISTTSMGPQPR